MACGKIRDVKSEMVVLSIASQGSRGGLRMLVLGLAIVMSVGCQCESACREPRRISPATCWARDEFRKYVRAVFNRDLPVDFVLLGDEPGAAADLGALRGTDGYAVRRRGDGTIVFVADNPRGHVNGVHRWLERNSDMIWPRPAGDCVVFTPRPGVDPASLDCNYIDVPAFKLRYHGGYSRGCWQFRRYLVRNAATPMIDTATLGPEELEQARMIGATDAYFDIFGGGHDMETRWFPVKEFYDAHPEFWALVDGKREPIVDRTHGIPQSQFCESNPAFAEAFAKSVETKIRNLPKSVGAISINIEDSVKTCQCDECNKPLQLPGGETIGPKDPSYKSTRFFLFFNKVARHVAKIRPDLKILQYAYLHLSVPPKIPVERNIVLKFCPYPRNMRESVFEGPSNRQWRDRAVGWLANTPSIYWREYYFCQCVYYPRPICDTAAVDLREIRRRGVEFVYTDAAGYFDTSAVTNRISIYSIRQPYSEHYDMCGLEAWAMHKLFWNPDLDPEELRGEFCRRTFGPAADDVRAFYRILHDSWQSETMPSCYNDESFPTAANFIAAKGLGGKCRACLESALGKADTAFRRNWIRSMIGILDRWLADAPSYLAKPISVPRIDGAEPGFDLDDGVWSRAAELPALTALRKKGDADRCGNRVKVFADDRSLVVGMDARTPGGRLYNRTPIPPRNFPIGERGEVSVSSPTDGYFHFCFDPDGNRYDAKGRDCGWRGDWSVRTQRCETGWKAVVRIPFETIGFNPHLRPDMRFLPLLAIYGDEKANCRHLSWNGGVPHEVPTWGILNIEGR